MSEARLESRGEGRYALAGDLTFATVPDLWRSRVSKLGNESTVNVDLADITRVDSAGIAMLIELTRAVQGRGGKISLEHAPPQLMAIATVSGLDAVLPFAGDGVPTGK